MTQDTTLPEGGASVIPPVVPPEWQSLIEAIGKDPVKAAEEIKSLRAEAKRNREAAAAAERAKAEAERQQLEKDKQFETLANQYKNELEAVKPKAEQLDGNLQYLTNTLERRIAALPKHFQALVPKYPNPIDVLQWLDDNAAVFRTQPPIDIGAGQQGETRAGLTNKKPMPDHYWQTARKLGISREKAQSNWDARNNAEE